MRSTPTPNALHTLLLTAVILLFVGCATEKTPTGGPEDKTPPECLSVYPVSGSVNIRENEEILLVFSEAMDPSIDKSAFTVFPMNSVNIKIQVRNREISVMPENAWPDTTVITLIAGNRIKDRHNNAMTSPLQISFTRDSMIPENTIQGTIHDLEKADVAYVALTRFHTHPDSILKYPEYLIQSDETGYFEFQYLPKDTFYMTGFLDWDKSNSYKTSSDGLVIPVHAAVLPDTLTSMENLLAVHVKNEIPRLLAAENLHPGKTELTFSKTPATDLLNSSFLFDGTPADTLLIDEKTVTCFHAAALSDSIPVFLKKISDIADYPMRDSSFYLEITAYEDSAYDAEQMGNMMHIFPKPGVDTLSGEFYTAADTLEISAQHIKGSFYALPDKAGKQGLWTVTPGSADIFTVSPEDSAYSWRLTFPVKAEYGSVLGKMEELLPGMILLLANDKHTFIVEQEDKQFVFPQALPGTYDLLYYVDRNENGRPDPGRRFPHEAPEILFKLDTDIQVRARWDTELETPYGLKLDN